MKKLDVELVRSLLNYDQETGIFTWRVTRSGSAHVGDVAGHLTPFGYIHMRIAGYRVYAHRLAWFYVYGEWPKDEIDHIDQDKAHNAISNLREADNSQNHANVSMYANNSSGIKGVRKYWKRFRATIGVKGTIIHLGTFDTPEEARTAYINAAKKHFGEFAKTNQTVGCSNESASR